MAKRKTATRKGGRSKGRPPTVYTGSSKRVINYLKKHPTATVAQARGHAEPGGEHKGRERRAKETGRLTEKERGRVMREAARNANARGLDYDDVRDGMMRWAERQKIEKFNRLVEGRRELTKRYKAGKTAHIRYRREKGKKVAYFTGDIGARLENIEYMNQLRAELELDDDDWIWYH